MVAVYRNGQWIDDAEEQDQQGDPLQPPMGLSLRDAEIWRREKTSELELQQVRKDAAAGGDTRPFWAPDVGTAVSDTGKIFANAGVGLVTDYADLAAGVVDVVAQTGNALQGKGFDWGAVMDDSDNPWTKLRREAFRTETQAGQAFSNLARLGTALVTLPKYGLKGLAFPFKMAGGVDALGDVSKAAKGIGNLFSKLDDLAQAKQLGKTGVALEALEQGFQKGSGAQNAAARALRNDWLGLTYADVSQSINKAPELKGVADWFDNVRTSTKALTQLTKGTPGARIRTIGEALVWDTFVAFNVYGEGDSEFDETLGDLAMSSGLPWLQQIGSVTATDPSDGALVRKGKQMLEGIAQGTALNAVIDMARVYRYAKNFKAAAPEQRKVIIEALNANSEEIGSSLGRSIVSNGRLQGERLPGQLDALQHEVDRARQAAGEKDAFKAEQLRQQQQQAAASQIVPYEQGPEVFSTPGVPLAEGQQGLNVEQLMANQQMVGQSTEALPGAPPPALLPEGQAPAMLPGGPEAQPAGSGPAGLLGGGGGPPAVVEPVQPVQVRELRAPEPTVTPDTIRSAFERDAFRAFSQAQELTLEEGPDGVMRSLTKPIRELMPRNRVDAMEYLEKFRPTANTYGVVHAADSVWTNFIYDRGLAEGWATIDPSTMKVQFNRKNAAALDRGDAAMKQAETLDEAESLKAFQAQFSDRVAGIEKQKDELLGQMDEAAAKQEDSNYQQWLAERDAYNGISMQPEVQEGLGKMEARNAYDEWEATQGQEKAAAKGAYDKWEADQAKAAAETDAIKAAQAVDALDNAEELRLTQAQIAKAAGAMTDDEVVREMLGQSLDAIEPALIERAPTGRAWEVFDRNGEMLGTARTRAAAQKIADQQMKRDRDALLARARQMEADQSDVDMSVMTGSPVYDSDIVGKVKLTDAQINAVKGILPELDQRLDQAWLAQRGESAFFNINQLGPQKRTFELTQGDMQALQDGIRGAIEAAGALKGSQKLRALRNLADKLDVEMKLLEPQARAQRFVNDVLGDTAQYLQHGEFCDFF